MPDRPYRDPLAPSRMSRRAYADGAIKAWRELLGRVDKPREGDGPKLADLQTWFGLTDGEVLQDIRDLRQEEPVEGAWRVWDVPAIPPKRINPYVPDEVHRVVVGRPACIRVVSDDYDGLMRSYGYGRIGSQWYDRPGPFDAAVAELVGESPAKLPAAGLMSEDIRHELEHRGYVHIDGSWMSLNARGKAAEELADLLLEGGPHSVYWPREVGGVAKRLRDAGYLYRDRTHVLSEWMKLRRSMHRHPTLGALAILGDEALAKGLLEPDKLHAYSGEVVKRNPHRTDPAVLAAIAERFGEDATYETFAAPTKDEASDPLEMEPA